MIMSTGSIDVKTMIQKLMDGWINEEAQYVAGVFSPDSGHFSQVCCRFLLFIF